MAVAHLGCNQGVRTQLAITENFPAQTAASFQEIFRALRKCAIHPITRRALLGSIKTNALNLKFLADEFVQIKAARDHVAPRRSGRSIVCVQRSADLFENLDRKKVYHANVIVSKMKLLPN